MSIDENNVYLDLNQKPIKNLSQLTLIYLWPDGQLVDFNCMDHSFTLEIIEKTNLLGKINPINGLTY